MAGVDRHLNRETSVKTNRLNSLGFGVLFDTCWGRHRDAEKGNSDAPGYPMRFLTRIRLNDSPQAI
jgi:hypothetical protein